MRPCSPDDCRRGDAHLDLVEPDDGRGDLLHRAARAARTPTPACRGGPRRSRPCRSGTAAARSTTAIALIDRLLPQPDTPITSTPFGTISAPTLSRGWNSARRSSSHFFITSSPPTVSISPPVGDELDRAGAVHAQPLLLEQRRQRFAPEPAVCGDRAPDRERRLVERQSLQRARDQVERGVARVDPCAAPNAAACSARNARISAKSGTLSSMYSRFASELLGHQPDRRRDHDDLAAAAHSTNRSRSRRRTSTASRIASWKSFSWNTPGRCARR